MFRDTVASVGFFPRYLPFVASNNGIKFLRHALAMDERRVKFLPSFVAGGRSDSSSVSPTDSPSGGATAQALPQEPMPSPVAPEPKDGQHKLPESNGKKGKKRPDAKRAKESVQKMYEDALNAREPPCDVKEVWFAGVHAGMFRSPFLSSLLL